MCEIFERDHKPLPMGALERTTVRLLTSAQTSLHTNSFYLMTASVANAGFGFLFWTAAARLSCPGGRGGGRGGFGGRPVGHAVRAGAGLRGGQVPAARAGSGKG